jgi:hypothetical protein
MAKHACVLFCFRWNHAWVVIEVVVVLYSCNEKAVEIEKMKKVMCSYMRR